MDKSLFINSFCSSKDPNSGQGMLVSGGMRVDQAERRIEVAILASKERGMFVSGGIDHDIGSPALLSSTTRTTTPKLIDLVLCCQ